jgi:plasmid stability protein
MEPALDQSARRRLNGAPADDDFALPSRRIAGRAVIPLCRMPAGLRAWGGPPSAWYAAVMRTYPCQHCKREPREDVVAALSIRGLDDDVRERLRIRAAQHGRSMEAEIRAILVDAVRDLAPATSLFAALLDRFGEMGGVELELPSRATVPRAADLSA